MMPKYPLARAVAVVVVVVVVVAVAVVVAMELGRCGYDVLIITE